MYRQDEDDTSFTNCSKVNHNLDKKMKKYRRIRITSPVIIQSFGNNNFAVESINEKQKNNNNEHCDNEFEDLKVNKIYKTNTNLTGISPDRNSTFYNSKKRKPLVKYKNLTHTNEKNNGNYTYNNISYINDDKSSSKNKTIIDDKTSNRQIYQKEDVDGICYPSGPSIFTHRKNKTDLNYHRFCSSFLPKNGKLKKKMAFKKCNIKKKEKIANVQKTPSLSKPKNQLEEFNIDKLKEIGDHLALKCININSQKKINKKNTNINVNDRKNINLKKSSEEKEKQKENEFINNMMMIDQKRKNSKNKLVLINRIKNSLKKNDLRKINLEGESKNRIKTINENYLLNSPQNKLMKVYNKSKDLVNDNTQRYIKRIKVNGKFVRYKFKLKPLKSFNDNDQSTNFNMNNNTCKNNLRKNVNYQTYYQLNDKDSSDISNKENQKTFYNDKINYDIIKNDKKINHILSQIDVLIDGPFIEAERDITLELRGSKNQRVLYRGVDF